MKTNIVKLESLQIIRAIAAILVVIVHILSFISFHSKDFILNHFYNTNSIGTIGVDIFFVVSGIVMYLISGNYINKEGSFLFKRLWRIIPIYWLLTFLFVLSNFFVNNMTEWQSIFKTITFIDLSKTNFISPALPVGWTLSFELYFYLVIFASLKFFKENFLKATSLFLISFVILGFLPINLSIFRFLTNPMLIYFVIGLMLLPLARKLNFKFGKILIFTSLILLVYLIFNGFDQVASPSYLYGRLDPWKRLFYFGIPSVLFVLGMINLEKYINKKNILTKLFILIGDSSYSLYLSHYLLLQIFFNIWFKFSSNPTFCFLFSLPFSICMSVLIYKYIEKPLLKVGKDFNFNKFKNMEMKESNLS